MSCDSEISNMNTCQISPKKEITGSQDIRLLPLFTFWDVQRHLETIIGHPYKCGRCCAQSSIYHHVITMLLAKDLKIDRYPLALTQQILRGHSNALAP